MSKPKKPAGQVALVGGGSGDPALLVVRAAEVLRAADLVLADERCPEALLGGLREDAELVRTPAGEPQGAALVAAAKDGRTVVRLLPGDPFLHPEGAKEAEAVLKAKHRLEVVPGVPPRAPPRSSSTAASPARRCRSPSAAPPASSARWSPRSTASSRR